MPWRTQINEKGVVTRYQDTDSGDVMTAHDYERRMQMQMGGYSGSPGLTAAPPGPGGSLQGGQKALIYPSSQYNDAYPSGGYGANPQINPQSPMSTSTFPSQDAGMQGQAAPPPIAPGGSPLIQPGAQILAPGAAVAQSPQPSAFQSSAPQGTNDGTMPQPQSPGMLAGQGAPPTAGGLAIQGKNLRIEGIPGHLDTTAPTGYRVKGFLDATSIAILLPTLVLLAMIIAAAHKKRLYPWQTIRTFTPPSGLMTPRDYERSFLCPPNLRRHGRLGKRNPNATWTDVDGVVVPFGFLARTHLPITIPIGRLPNKNMFIVAPTGSGKTTLMRAIIKALLAKPCVVIALEAKANDPHLDERREGFKYTVLPEAHTAGFDTLYFNPLDHESVHWNPLDVPPIVFASSVVQNINSLNPEDQHWAERDHGYIAGLAQLLKWGAVQVVGEDENGVASKVEPLRCNPNGLMRLVNNRRNIVESLRRLKTNPEVPAAQLTELTQTLSSIIRTDTDWDKNIQGVRGRLRMFNNRSVLEVTEQSNIDLKAAMHRPTVLIFGAPASLGPDAESLASCFVYQLQQALHTRYGTVSVLPLFAFFDEYQTLNMDIAGRLSAIVRGANGGLAIILQNVSQITSGEATGGATNPGSSELKTIFSNAAVRVCLHNADETTAKFFSEEIGKHAVVVPGVSDHYLNSGFGIFPTSWNRIHSQQVVARVDPDAIKRMEKHHALVYLSPAGDPEFGEIKPLMVDLRGIEEIARLHLLHNVAGRRTPPGVAPSAAGVPPGMVAMPGAPGQMAGPAPMPSFAGGGPSSVAQAAAQAATGAVAGAAPQLSQPGQMQDTGSAPRICGKCGHSGGNRKFCIQCGNFLGSLPSQVQLETSGALSNQGAPQAAPQPYTGSYPVQAQPSLPQPQPSVAQPVSPNAPRAYAGPYPAQPNAPPFPAFTKPTSAFPDAQTSTASRRAPLFDGPLQIAEAAQQSYTSGKRAPLTSLTPDLGKLGFSPQGVPSEAQAQANQPGGNPQQAP
jgi:type IV secretory pathway TraG/TraD family ATPase VirD4